MDIRMLNSKEYLLSEIDKANHELATLKSPDMVLVRREDLERIQTVVERLLFFDWTRKAPNKPRRYCTFCGQSDENVYPHASNCIVTELYKIEHICKVGLYEKHEN